MKSVGFVFQAALPLTEACLWRSFQQDPPLRPALCWDGAALFSATKCWDHFHPLCTADGFKMPFSGVQAGISVCSLENWGVAVPHCLCWTAESCITRRIWGFHAAWSVEFGYSCLESTNCVPWGVVEGPGGICQPSLSKGTSWIIGLGLSACVLWGFFTMWAVMGI